MPPIPQPERCPLCGSADIRRSGVRITSAAVGAASRRVVGPARVPTSWRWVCGSCGRPLGSAPARP